VQIILNSGSSNNFLQPQIVKGLKLPIQPISNLKVLVGNGNSLVVEGLVSDLKVIVQGHTLKLLIYLPYVLGTNLVLGAAWLARDPILLITIA